jgi:hypothetical protein
MRRTDIIRTGGNEAAFNPVMTKIALLGNAFIIVKFNGIVRTRRYTGLTTVTQIIIHDHHTVGSLGNRLFGAGVGAGWFIAVSAQIDPENKIELPINYPGPVF